MFFFKQKTAYEMRISDWSSDGALPIWADPAARLLRQRPRGVAPGQPSVAQLSLARRRRRTPGRAGPARLAQPLRAGRRGDLGEEIGRESCRERVLQHVEISVAVVAFKKKNNSNTDPQSQHLKHN